MEKKLLFLGGILFVIGLGLSTVGNYVFSTYNQLSWPIAAINTTLTETDIVGVILMILGFVFIIGVILSGIAKKSSR